VLPLGLIVGLVGITAGFFVVNKCVG